ncbi:MAG: hypothetical protein DSY43_05935 [Gammaproteobacteria bacterium]|nr:MAG: hypothetical protein DSY43_05935 [Gammaproteobacteria bacterium]
MVLYKVESQRLLKRLQGRGWGREREGRERVFELSGDILADFSTSHFEMDGIVDPEYMKDLVLKKKWTHKRISEELRRKYPSSRGLSEMSVRRFCSKHSIHRTSRMTDGELDVVVHNAVSKVCDYKVMSRF